MLISKAEQTGNKSTSETFILSEMVTGLINDISELAILRSQRLESYIASDIKITGDRDLIQRAISNLLSNAIMHSPEQAVITIMLEGKKLIVRNGGIQISREDLPRLFEPFYRVDASRSSKTGGSGMGLYFAKIVFDRHGASCFINNTADGVEVIVEFSLL